MTSGAKLLIKCLEANGVEYIFGIPGAKIDAVFDALNDSSIRLITCRHEQNAVFMAQAYGRLTGRPGIVLVTSGPGVANLTTGLATANTEGDPVIAIGGNVSRAMKFKASHQNIQNDKLMEAVTKASLEINMPELIPEIIANAFQLATSPQSGAVFISFPQDIGLAEVKLEPIAVPTHLDLGQASGEVLQRAAKLIKQARRPAILLGLEASRPENTQAIQDLLKSFAIATVSTYQAAGVIPRSLLSCFVGRVGLFKNQPGDELLDDADLVITIGYNPVEYEPEKWNDKPNKSIIHINFQSTDWHQHYQPQEQLLGEIKQNLENLSQLLGKRDTLINAEQVQSLQAQLKSSLEVQPKRIKGKMHPLDFIHTLKNKLDDNAYIISDIGSHYMWLARYYFVHKPHHLLFSNGQQTLGVGLPWAMSTRLVYPQAAIVSVSGDGGFLFSAMELETAVREEIPIVHCIWNDGSYNMVKEQELLKYKRESGVHLGQVDFVKFAESFNALGFKAETREELEEALNQALKAHRPCIIDIPIDYSDNRQLFIAVEDNIGH